MGTIVKCEDRVLICSFLVRQDSRASGIIKAAESLLQHKRFRLCLQGAEEKSGPLNFFAVFSATVWDFNMKFYSFIYENLLHLTAK